LEAGSFHWCSVTGVLREQEATDTSWNTEGSKNIRKLLHCEGDWALARVAREVVESPSLEIFKSHPDIVLGNWIYLALLEQGVGLDDLQEVPSNLNYSVIRSRINMQCQKKCS